jgi:hypothetical protein
LAALAYFAQCLGRRFLVVGAQHDRSRTRAAERTRATKAEVEALLDIIAAGRPMTVRQVFYQATVGGLVETAESGYAKVKRSHDHAPGG